MIAESFASRKRRHLGRRVSGAAILVFGDAATIKLAPGTFWSFEFLGGAGASFRNSGYQNSELKLATVL